MSEDVVASIGLGANLGDCRRTLSDAAQALAELPQSELLAVSPTYRSAPVDASGPDYYNTVVLLRTSLSASRLLAELQRIESDHGRSRPYRNSPRTLDLDLLLYGDHRYETAELTVPHPRAHERAFVLRPLADVSPDAFIPAHGRIVELLPRVANQRIERLDP